MLLILNYNKLKINLLIILKILAFHKLFKITNKKFNHPYIVIILKFHKKTQ
jgi:hypothetical protein